MFALSRRVSAQVKSVVGSRFLSATRPPVTTLSEDEQMLQEAVRGWAVDVLKPKVPQMDKEGKLDLAILNGMFEQGLMGIEVPEEYSGAGHSFVGSCIAIEELAKVDAGISVIMDIQNTLINTALRKYGTEDQKTNFLTRLATNTLGSFCLSEPGSGSDAFAMTSKAKLDGNDYVLNGEKCWISNANEAGIFVIFANANPDAGYKGITAFLVDRDTPGLVIGKKEDKMGIRASSTCQLFLEDLRVPKENILGELGQGYKIAIGLLNEGRIGIGAQMVGLAQGAFESAMPYVHQRKQFGRTISSFQGMQFNIAEAAVDIEAARLMVYNAARKKEAGENFIKEAAMAKLYASRTAERVASSCIEMMGGVGFIKDYPAEKYYRDAKIGSIYEGTSNLQLQTIAKLVSQDYE